MNSPRVGLCSRPTLMVEHSEPSDLVVEACLLLAGGLKPSPLVERTGGSVLDLYLRPGVTVMGAWLDRFQEIAGHLGRAPTIQVVHGTDTPPPSDAEARRRGIKVQIEADRQQWRGPAGAVKDACIGYRSEATVLVAEAGRYLGCSLVPMLKEHEASGAAITVACNPDDSPAGVFLIRCQTLELVPAIGFMDLKEQWLKKALEASIDIRVHHLREPHSYELRTREDFLVAARVAGGLVCTAPTTPSAGIGVDVPSTPSELRHSLDEGASIGAGAVIVDSVIMQGAQVGAGAVVARSVVCPSGVVAPGATVVDAVVPPGVFAGVGTRRTEVKK
jgi:hypothetical protein